MIVNDEAMKVSEIIERCHLNLLGQPTPAHVIGVLTYEVECLKMCMLMPEASARRDVIRDALLQLAAGCCYLAGSLDQTLNRAQPIVIGGG